MRTIGKTILGAMAVLAALAGGCGQNSCPSESPQVNAVANCTAPAGSTVSYQLELCPTCNQTLTGCTVDMSGAGPSGGTISLNPVVEACESVTSCGPGGPSCLANPACSFKVPSATDNTQYTVVAFDPISGRERQGTLTVGGPPSCSFASL